MGKGLLKVQTWGTHPDGGSGLMNFLETAHRGENPGHASLEMRLPVTDENTALITQYCQKRPRIPYKKRMHIKEDGTEEEEYVVRFSFIPGKTEGFHLNASYKDDTIYERTGHHTSDRHLLEVSELQERRGNKRVISIFPACTLTEKGRSLDFSTPQGQYILKIKEIKNCKDLLDTAELLIKKCSNLKEGQKNIDFYHPSNKTVLIAANQLGIILPRGEIPVDQLDSILDMTEIKESVNAKIEQLRKEKSELRDKIDQKELKEKNKEIISGLNTILNKIKDHNPESNASERNTLEVLSLEITKEIEKLKISEEEKIEFSKLIEANDIGQLKGKLEGLRGQYVNENNRILEESLLFYHNEDDYLCRGKPADGEVQLPLGTGENDLDAKAMLEQMRQIVDAGYAYDLYTHNCSSTALSILKAGRDGTVSEVSPAKGFTTTNPQTVYNEAISLRDKVCPISPSQSLADLDNFYTFRTVGTKVIPGESSSLHEAILNFAVDNIFPEDEDIKNKTFYVFSQSDRENLLKDKDKLIPTELLRDLWGIIPERTLPLSKDGSNNVVIDRNMTVGQLVQGLSILAQNKAESRLEMQNALIESKEKDPYELLKNKIESEIVRLSKITDPKSVQKTADLTNAYINMVEKLKSDPPLKSEDKAALLFQELTPKLKVNTGFNLRESTSYREVARTAQELGVIKNTDSANRFRGMMGHERRETEKQETTNESTCVIKNHQ